MAKEPRLSDAAANLAVDVVMSLLDGGYLRIYSGTIPATADTTITDGQVLLAELRFDRPAFLPAVNGMASSSPITKDSSAPSSGTATWFRTFESDGISTVFDGTIGTAGADINLNSTTIAIGAEVRVDSLTYTQPKAQP